MHKRVGSIEVNRHEWLPWATLTFYGGGGRITGHMTDVELRNLDDVRDLHYAIGELLREMTDPSAAP